MVQDGSKLELKLTLTPGPCVEHWLSEPLTNFKNIPPQISINLTDIGKTCRIKIVGLKIYHRADPFFFLAFPFRFRDMRVQRNAPPPANFEEMLTRLNSLREVLDLRINATFTESFVQIGLFVSKIYLDELFCTHALSLIHI